MNNYDYFTLSDGTEVHILYTKPERNRLKGHIQLNGKDMSMECEITSDGEESARSQICGRLNALSEVALEQFRDQHKMEV